MYEQLSENRSADFLRQAGVDPLTECMVRRIGTDNQMVRAIIERIAIGEKTMFYSLPWIAAQEGREAPVAGSHIVVLDAAGSPALLLRITRVERLAFGEVGESDIEREGIPMRTLEAWRPLHIDVWNQKLAPLGMTVDDEMPVWAEYFDLLYTAEDYRPA
jgi:uncharacterized protein YhfF